MFIYIYICIFLSLPLFPLFISRKYFFFSPTFFPFLVSQSLQNWEEREKKKSLQDLHLERENEDEGRKRRKKIHERNDNKSIVLAIKGFSVWRR